MACSPILVLSSGTCHRREPSLAEWSLTFFNASRESASMFRRSSRHFVDMLKKLVGVSWQDMLATYVSSRNWACQDKEMTKQTHTQLLTKDSLIKNSVSPIPKIFGLSLQIFALNSAGHGIQALDQTLAGMLDSCWTPVGHCFAFSAYLGSRSR